MAFSKGHRTHWLIIASLIITACSNDDMKIENSEVTRSTKQRITSPQVSPAELSQLVGGNSTFAFDLYRAVRQDNVGKNLFYSPFSISIALAMTYAGARGNTETEMAQALQFTLSQDRLHPNFNALDLELMSRGQEAQGKDGGKFRLNIANATWGQKDYSFLPAYLDTLAENYDAGLRLLDFSADAETARLTINEWVSQKTEQKIKDLIAPGMLDSLTRLVLTNAVYFNAAWKDKFDANATHDGEFQKIDGSKVTVAMMQKKDDGFGYAKAGGCQAVELPYDGEELSMVVLLPDAGTFESFEAALNSDKVDNILNNLQTAMVDLTIPKFKTESGFLVASAMQSLGMKDAFDDNADFSGMSDQALADNLHISDIIHKAFIAIDEAGTEAAAATAVVMKANAIPAESATVKLDRPFLFLIRDIKTGTILFVGRIMDPKA